MQLDLLEGLDIEKTVAEPDCDDRFAPIWLIEIARKVMGSIETDPASCPKANAFVKARFFHTKKGDGLTKSWWGSIWLYPPYSMPLIEKFSIHLCQQHLYGDTREACMLTRNSTETPWCQRLLMSCDRFCLLNKKLTFSAPNKTVVTDEGGHILFYFGDRKSDFERLLKPHGIVFTSKKT